jgi:hypothetical protein
MSPHRRSYRLLLALLSAIALLAGACGGGDDPELESAGEETAAEGEDDSSASDAEDAAAVDDATDAADDGTGTPAEDTAADTAAGEDETAGDTGEEAAGEDETGEEAGGDGEPEVGGGTAAFPTPAPVTGEPAFTSASKLTTVGLDDVFFGDTVRDIRSKVSGDWVGLPAADARPSCFTMQPAGGPEGTVFMILDGRVERIDLASPAITTRSGIGVGSTVADITELFESNIETVTVDGGEEIVFIPTDADDREFRIIWTTDGTTVTAMRAGRIPGVLAAAPCG